MIIKTNEFKTVANKILGAVGVDKNAGNLELKINGNALYLSVTNREFYVSVKFPVEDPEPFAVTVDAALFLNLISGITAEEFTLNVNAQKVQVQVGKSKYDIAIIMENGKPMALPPILVNNVNVEMPIDLDILSSILNVNSKEVAKNKAVDTNELRKLYFIDETGCFTFASGSACLNSFALQSPVKLLLNDRIVKLFKLFEADVNFKMGYDSIGSMLQTKISLETDSIYLAARVTNDDLLLARVEKPCAASKSLINDKYANNLVLNASDTAAAIGRLMTFTKNCSEKANMSMMPAKFVFTPGQLEITDLNGNIEVVTVENDSYLDANYTMFANMSEIKTILDSCKINHVTLNCGNHRTFTIVRGTISNLISELQEESV